MTRRSLGAMLGAAFLAGVAACAAGPSSKTTPAIDVPSASPDAAAPPPAGTSSTAAGVECSVDADCGGDTCCHPRACIPQSKRPSCAGQMCTMECRGGTLDCGGGACLCQNGKCGIVLKDRRHPDAGP